MLVSLRVVSVRHLLGNDCRRFGLLTIRWWICSVPSLAKEAQTATTDCEILESILISA